MKTRKTTLRLIAEHLVAILILCSMIHSTVVLFTEVNGKILSTVGDLIVLNDNIRFYNESPIKTDESTEKCQEYMDARRALYNSPDFIVRSVATKPALVKILIALVVLASYPAAILLDGYLILRYIGIVISIFTDKRSRNRKKTYNNNQKRRWENEVKRDWLSSRSLDYLKIFSYVII